MNTEDRKRVTIRKTRSGFASREQGAGFALLAITGGLAFILGTFYLVRQLNSPFDINYEGPQFVSSAEQREAELAVQRTTDTDGDGLLDYDELYVYETSPYLVDSDGDGLNDALELTMGKDPLCPEGESCMSSLYNPYATTGSQTDLIDLAEGTTEGSTEDLGNLQDAVRQLNAEQVRQLLLESGADPEVVNALSDEELLEIYQKVISDLESSGELEPLLEASVEDSTNPTE